MTLGAIMLACQCFFALLFGYAVAISAFDASALAADAEYQADDWNRTVRAAEQEGQVVLYSLTEIGEAIANGGFQKKFPKIKMSVVAARGGEHISRIMAERQSGKISRRHWQPRQHFAVHSLSEQSPRSDRLGVYLARGQR